jgi:periplasmic copper chaperone A
MKATSALPGLLFLAALEAQAAVTLEQPQARSGTEFKATFQVARGCMGAPTSSVRVQLPDGVSGARPQPKPGWKVEVARAKDRVVAVEWSGGPLAEDHFDEFKLIMVLPRRLGAVRFRVVQGCVTGQSVVSEPVLELTPKQ